MRLVSEVELLAGNDDVQGFERTSWRWSRNAAIPQEDEQQFYRARWINIFITCDTNPDHSSHKDEQSL
jgi:hypothetical protein